MSITKEELLKDLKNTGVKFSGRGDLLKIEKAVSVLGVAFHSDCIQDYGNSVRYKFVTVSDIGDDLCLTKGTPDKIITLLEFLSWFDEENQEPKPTIEEVMTEELEKQIESAECVLKRQDGEPDVAAVSCNAIDCDDCFGSGLGCGLTYTDFKCFIIKHKPEPKLTIELELEEATTPTEKPKLNKREQILENEKNIKEWCSKALQCKDSDGELLGLFLNGEYRLGKNYRTPEQALKVANWIINLEKAVK